MQNSELDTLQREKLQAATELARLRSRRWGYRYFINEVFSASFAGAFVGGEYIDSVALKLQNYKYTMDITGRDHMKSTRLFADLMYRMFIDDGTGWEAHYFSYAKELAAYQLTKLKEEYIKRNPFFIGLADNKRLAESVLSYNWPNGRKMTVTPHGLLGAKRGIHGDIIMVDDAMKTEAIDEGDNIDPASIRKINNVMISDLLPMVKKGGVCRIVGTAMTPSDFYFNEGMQQRFKTDILDTMVNEKERIALWPEWKSFDELESIRQTMGDDKFNREYRAMPVTTSNSYIDKEKLLDSLTEDENWQFIPHPDLDNETVVAGFDIGKKSHPSHLAIFIRYPDGIDIKGNEQYRFKQIYSFWMDHWDYGKQVEYLNIACDYFNIDRLSYDNTRGEFEAFSERHELGPAMQPIVLNAKRNSTAAAYFGFLVDRDRVSFIKETRQFNQILQMGKDLKAPSSPEGHADSFWSCALAFFEENIKKPRIRSLYD